MLFLLLHVYCTLAEDRRWSRIKSHDIIIQDSSLVRARERKREREAREGYHLYTSSNGRVSAKHESQTSLTTLVACTSSLQCGRAMTDWMARMRTQFWNCCVSVQCPLVMASLVHLHSPLNMDARICGEQD